MMPLASFFRRLQHLARRKHHDADLREEMAFHEAALRDDLIATGVPAGDAPSRARRAMGNVTVMREASRGVWVAPSLTSIAQDLAYAVRGLRRQPRFSTVAIATLGIAIGANASVFTAFNSTFLNGWPVADPARLYHVSTIRDGRERLSDFSLEEYHAVAERLSSSASVIAMACVEGFDPGCDVQLNDVQARPAYVTGNTFDVLGVPMTLGQAFTPSQDREGAPEAVVILGYHLWMERFAGDRSVIGRLVHIDGVPFTVTGVAPERLAGVSVIRSDLWLPLSSLALLRRRDLLGRTGGLEVVARVPASTTPAQVRAEIEGAVQTARATRLASLPAVQRRVTTVRLARASLDPNPGRRRMGYAMFGLMFVGSGLVILLACANLANLHLARAAARSREIAVRASLGASGGRILRQLLTESLVLAMAATALGVVIATFASTYLLEWIADAPLSSRALPDARVLAYAAIITFVTCAAFGMTPALHAARGALADALKGRYGLGGVNLSLRHKFLATQVAVSVVVLCGAGFLLRGAVRATSMEYGFTANGVSGIRVELPATLDSAQQGSFARALRAEVATRLDARTVGLTTELPFSGEQNGQLVLLPGQDSSAGRYIRTLSVTPGYFDVLGVSMREGRALTMADDGGNAVVVNERLARMLWPTQPAVGQVFTLGSPREVVGVVKDADTEAKSAEEGAPRPKVYEPFGAASFDVLPSFVAATGAGGTEREIEAIAHRLTPLARVTAEPLTRRLARRADESRRTALLVGVMGVTALLLVSIGIFGVFAFVVQQRTREIAIRVALGARGAEVVRVIVASGARPMVMGTAVGLVAAMAESRLLSRFLYGLSPLDPVTYVAIVVVLGIAAVGAMYLPALRATRIVPAIALRGDEG
ncbi:MAG: hypothetical protein JWM95_2382 [Gemmatimonadetes bacterium]|nr:hypothetical protein [Gemmatimonadota bacterium]